jgi:hypothetical protein
MSVTLTLSEIDADFVAQVVQNDIDMMLLVLDHPDAHSAEQLAATRFRIERLSHVLSALVTEPSNPEEEDTR